MINLKLTCDDMLSEAFDNAYSNYIDSGEAGGMATDKAFAFKQWEAEYNLRAKIGKILNKCRKELSHDEKWALFLQDYEDFRTITDEENGDKVLDENLEYVDFACALYRKLWYLRRQLRGFCGEGFEWQLD